MTTAVIHGEGPALNLSGRIPELDGLRGIAIGMVLIWHFVVVPSDITHLPRALVPGLLTWTGVDLFFVLSGFLIGGILLDARTSTNYFQVFYTRRFFRIVPVYALVLLSFPVLAYARHWAHPIQPAGLAPGSPPWYSYWTFTQNFWMAWTSNLGFNSLAMTWSLAVEEQFYLTLPLLVRLFSGRRLLTLVGVGIVLAPLLRTVSRFFSPHNWGLPYVLMPCRADALLLGVLAAILLRDPAWQRRVQGAHRLLASVLLVLFLGIVYLTLRAPDLADRFMSTAGYSWIALFYVSLLLYALTRPDSLMSRALRVKWLGWLGTIAYGTDVFHQGIQRTLFRIIAGSDPVLPGRFSLLITLAALLLTLVVARLSWRFFEVPLMRIGHRSRYKLAKSETNKIPTTAPEPVRS